VRDPTPSLPDAAGLVLNRIDPSVFPPNFMWGVATSAHQHEGNDIYSDWWAWSLEGRTKSGEHSGLAADLWNRFESDLDLAVALHIDTYRFSLSWSRLFPEPEMPEPDAAAVARYDEFLAALRERHIRPMVTLHHFATPKWITDQGRWETGEAIEDFRRVAEFCGRRWGAQVDWWITINEPEVFAFHGWFRHTFPPGKSDFGLALRVLGNVMQAHAQAYQTLHAVDTIDADGDGVAAQVGVAKLIVPVEPRDWWNPVDLWTAAGIAAYTNSYWFDANLTGVPELRWPSGEILVPACPEFRDTLDFVGVNYYSRQIIHMDPALGFQIYDNPNGQLSELGIEIYPRGLYDTLQYLSRWRLPLIVTENGIADSQDRWRSEYIIGHVTEMSRFMGDRPDVPVLGYMHWSLTDHFEWENGFAPRFGLYAIDYATQERTARPSAHTYADLIAAVRGKGSSYLLPRNPDAGD